MQYVVKRDGREVSFNSVKIATAIKKASDEVGEKLKESELLDIVKRVINYIEDLGKERVTVEKIQNLVEKALLDSNYENIKIAYSNYRKERTKVREIKSDLMRAIEKIGIETDRDNGATSCC